MGDAMMRTNIDIDDKLMADAMKATGQTTKKATVEAALLAMVKLDRQRRALEELEGLGWDGDLDQMRRGRFADKEPW
jgi:Arc/MetJ family transcription regulator